MNKIILSCAAVVVSIVLSGIADAGQQKSDRARMRGHDPMQASAAMTGVPVVVRYDSACRAKYAISSVGYHDCLQRLPATALVGGR